MNHFKLILLMGLILASCQKAPYQIFQDENRIQFGPEKRLFYNPTNTFQDSLKLHTFAYLENSKMSDTVYFDLYTMGETSSKDRAFKIVQEQVANEQNAIADVHYKSFSNTSNSNLYVIKAGQMHSRVPVVLLRDSSLREMSVVLKIVVQENEYFKKGQEQLIWRKLIFTDKLNRPSSWNVGILGKYSEVKHRFMISATQQKWDDAFILEINRDVQAQHYWLGKVKTALLKYNNDHPTDPLRDEDQELIIFP